MDPLSDILSLLKPRSILTAGFDAGGDWAVRFDDQAGRIKCYSVTSGSCLLWVEDAGPPVRIAAGDSFVLPTGRPFMLGSDLTIAPASATDVFMRPRVDGVAVHNGGGGFYLSGSRFEVDGRHAAMLLRSLPPIIHLRGANEQATLRWAIARLREEVRAGQPGSSLIAHHLAHLMLVQALRLHLNEQPSRGVGWFFALADPQVSTAIAAMHAEPARRWTLKDLAAHVQMSRSVFAQRFRELVGETPIAYLTRWRMMLASERLATTKATLSEAAVAVGYESENAFSTAFKRVMGAPPRQFARARV